MLNIIDQELLKNLLGGLTKAYPRELDINDIIRIAPSGTPLDTITERLDHLAKRGLVTLSKRKVIGTVKVFTANAQLTKEGFDFAVDNGLPIGDVTIQFDADTINELLIAQIQSSGANPTANTNLINKLKVLPGNAVKKILLSGFEKGIAGIPNITNWANNILSNM